MASSFFKMFSSHTSSLLVVSIILILLPSSRQFHIPDSNPLLSLGDQVRERHLYTENHRRGIFLQIGPDGQVSGSPAQSLYSVLELRSVGPGKTVIKGVSSSLYLCVDSGGCLRGQSQYMEADCTFRELLLADGYTRFLSSRDGLPVSLTSNRSPEKLGLPFTRFLPLHNNVKRESATESPPQNPADFHMDSADPLGMALDSVVSPQFSMDEKR